MTLGRTSSGAIKTKTDGGLRAVNCACCGCNWVAIPENLRSLFEDATIDSITMWGYAPEDFFPLGPAEGYPEGSWLADWFVTDGDLFILGSLVYSTDGFLYGPASAMEYQNLPEINGAVFLGKLDGCILPEFTGVTGTFTINGAGEFPWYYLLGDEYTSSPPPNIVVS
jgi:hypothetical protein